MRTILITLSLIFSLQLCADCRPKIEQDLLKRINKLHRVDHVGKVTTGGAFLVVGGFYGVMGVYLLGPLWAGAIVGATFGTAVALPVGTVFIIAHKVQKNMIAARGQSLSIINYGDEFDILFQKISVKRPDLSRETISQEIEFLNETNALCDGIVAKANRFIPTTRVIATPKDILRWFTHQDPQKILLN
jgi:hypothetical protein